MAYGYTIGKKSKLQEVKIISFAEGSLTWWAIGASLIASNISAEQFIGMSGEGFFTGVAVAAYEWLAAIALIIIAVWFIPIYLKNKIYTMPQFFWKHDIIRLFLLLWLFLAILYVIVNLTSILYLGAVAIDSLLGGGHLHIIMVALLLMAFGYWIGWNESHWLHGCYSGGCSYYWWLCYSLYGITGCGSKN